jgi:hypothetical protein
MHRYQRILSVAKITLSCVLFFAIAFGGFEAWFRYFNRTNDNKVFRLTEPLPYQNTPYFSRAFIEESFSEPGGWITPSGTHLILPKNYKGKYFHVQGGLRVTIGQPRHFNRRILFFGGSTIYCSEVPDDVTIPSLVQKKITQLGYRNIAVFNYGTTTVTSSQQLERLRGIGLQPGDIIIFYDGVNDVYQGVFNARPKSTILSDNRQRSSVMKMVVWLSQYSAFFKHILNEMERNFIPMYLLNQKSLAEIVDRAINIYRENQIQAYKYSHEHGADFIHFLQPNLFTLKMWTPYEKNLIRLGAPIAPKGIELAFSAAYPKMRETFRTGQIGFRNVDLSSALDDMDSPNYLDICHVTDRANAVIAQKMVDYLINLRLIGYQ